MCDEAELENDCVRLITALRHLDDIPADNVDGVAEAVARHIAAKALYGWPCRLQWPGSLFPVT